MILSVTFTAKFELVFLLTFENALKEHRFLYKTVLGIFKIALSFRDWYVFMWQSVEILNVFNALTLIQIFWKTETFFKKLENHFLVETTKIENTSFLFKTTSSEANVKTNRMADTKLTYLKEGGVFPVTALFFWKIFFSFRTS